MEWMWRRFLALSKRERKTSLRLAFALELLVLVAVFLLWWVFWG